MRWTTSSSAASRRPSPDPEARFPGECGRVRPHSFFCLRGRPAGPRLRAPGARDQLLIGRDNGGLRGLFAFDLSAIPSAASITSAAFELWIPQLGLGTVKSLELGPLLKDFVEGSGNSSSSATAVGTRLGFTLAPAFVSEANAAIAAARPLRLMLAMAGDSSGGNRFASDDHPTVAQRPRLTLHYRIAHPTVPAVAIGSAPSALRKLPAALTGSVGNAPSGSRWSLVSGPGDVTFAEAALPATSATFSASGRYLLRLSAANAHGESSRTLEVNVAPNPAIFSEWQAIHWPGGNDPELVGDAADPDGDGLANLLECALGLSPLASDPAPTTIESPPGTRSRFVRLRVRRP